MPGCSSALASCGSACVNLQTDVNNCGACNTKCATGQSCSAGKCECAGGLAACGSSCVNMQSDGDNCGACGTVCSGGQVCSQGQCAAGCAAGEMPCGNSCANTMTDATNCGFCENKCAGGQACTSGSCGCGPGQATCNGACVDVMANAANCGTCGTMCGNGQTCSAGKCTGGSVGTGGTTGTGGSGGSGGNMPSGGSGGGTTVSRNGCETKAGLIADFEEGPGEKGAPAFIAHEGRTGGWEMFNDKTSMTQTMAVEPSGGTAACDKHALHVKGSGYTMWGAGFGFSFSGPPTAPMPYNAKAQMFTGIRFKAKLGASADPKSAVRFNIATPWTEAAVNPGGTCMPTVATPEKAATACYQHVGRFLPPGAGAGELTQTWQTYNFCFDRDLYPLSLPSNLTNEQRDNIASSMLKVQFQFNQGKDYSGPYTTMYPAFPKSLPFDFWLDDVSLFTGECPTMTPNTNNGMPAKPFPQNANVGTCVPATGAARFATAIAQAYARWTTKFVRNNTIVAPEQQNAVTSEAMGYGMMIAAAMGDKAAFDKFHAYVIQQGGTAGGLMTWKQPGGSGSASDGDIDIAYALLMGHAQWPAAGYKAASDAMAAAILRDDIVSNVVRGGSTFKTAPFNASYFAPAAFRAFGPTFAAAITRNYELVTANVATPTAGIPTDWASPESGAPSDAGGAQVTSEIIDGTNGAMGYDAARVPWRLGLDACKGGGNTAALKSIVDFFAAKYNMGASIDLMKAGWYKSASRGGIPHPMSKDLQGSYIGPIGAGAMAMNNKVMQERAFRAILDILESNDFNGTYFPSTVGLLTALMMSGNFPTP